MKGCPANPYRTAFFAFIMLGAFTTTELAPEKFGSRLCSTVPKKYRVLNLAYNLYLDTLQTPRLAQRG